MLSRSVKFAHVVLLVFAALVSFLFLREMEQQAPLEVAAHVKVRDEPSRQQAGSAQVTAAVEAVARDQHVNLVREEPDLQNPEGARHLYVAVGNSSDASAQWERTGYPAYSQDMRTTAHSIDQARDLEPRGDYFVVGPPEAGHALVSALAPLGYYAETRPFSLGTWISESSDGPHTEVLAWCVLAVMLAAVIAVGSGVVLNARGYGVLRLQGYGFGRVLWRDARQLAVFWVRAAVVVLTCVLGFLALYNNLAGWQLWAQVTGVLLAVFIGTAAATHVLALALTQRASVLGALKGEVSAGWTLVSVYGVRVAAVLLTLTIAGSAAQAGQRMGEYQTTRAAYAQIGAATHVELNGHIAPREEARVSDTVGPWLRQLDRAGELLLTVNQDRLGDYAMLRTGDTHRNVLVVNNEVLKRQTLLDQAGRPIQAPAPANRNARVLLPESLSGDPAAITEAVTANFRMGPHGETDALPLQVDNVRMRAGQSVFTYGAGVSNKAEYRSFVRDPVIVVLGNSPEILDGRIGNSFYMAFASQGYVAVSRPELALQALSDPRLRGYVNGISPVAQQAAVEYRNVAQALRLAVLDTVTALGVLVLTGLSVAVVYTRKRAQLVFVRYISGWTFTKAHRLLIAGEGALVAVLVGATAWNTWATMKAEESSLSHMNPLLLGGWEPVVVLGIAGTGIGITLAAVGLLQRRLVRERSAEA